MARLTLWYSVQNGGDGSAYPHWFENERLTEMDQELMPEGWGETCNGSITIEGDNLRVVGTHITTVDEFVNNLDRQINHRGNYYNKRLATQFRDELRPEPIVRNIGPNDPYGEEKVEERVKKYNNFK